MVRPRPSSRKALSGLGRLLRGRGAFAGLLNSFWFGMTGFTVGDLHVAQLDRGGKAQRVSHDFVRRLVCEFGIPGYYGALTHVRQGAPQVNADRTAMRTDQDPLKASRR